MLEQIFIIMYSENLSKMFSPTCNVRRQFVTRYGLATKQPLPFIFHNLRNDLIKVPCLLLKGKLSKKMF